ncbi:unnamed protein product [Microthlaspi erraticum]|uniref:Uncharacterized protein n=1 Tax=Microthlaspi erraticum TaxID=1685480 RepID=A0A6D2K6A6_9BRAS|nr:unnamed protein product [Microthlaspi erraticum]
MEFRVLEKKERFLCFQGKGDLPWPRKVLGRWILSRSSDLVGQIRGERFRPRPIVVSRIDRHGRSVPIRKSAERGRFFLFCVPRTVSVSRDESIRPSTSRSFPARPWSARMELLGQNHFARPRPMFGADCVFTPFSPSILS